KIWDAATGQSLRTLKGHSNLVDCVAFSPDGRYLASGSRVELPLFLSLTFNGLAAGGIPWSLELGEVKIWDTVTWKEFLSLRGHTDWVSSVAFSPGGLLASASADSTVKLWNLDAGQCIRTFEGQSKQITC